MKKSLLAVLLLVFLVIPGCGGYEESASAPAPESAEELAPVADPAVPMPPDPIDIIIDPTVNPTTGWTLGTQNVSNSAALEGTNTLSPLVIGRTIIAGNANWQITFRDGTTANVKSIAVQFAGGSLGLSKNANNVLQWSVDGTVQTAYTSTTLGDYAWPANMLIPAATTGTNPPVAANFTYVLATGASQTVPISSFKKMVIRVNDE